MDSGDVQKIWIEIEVFMVIRLKKISTYVVADFSSKPIYQVLVLREKYE